MTPQRRARALLHDLGSAGLIVFLLLPGAASGAGEGSASERATFNPATAFRFHSAVQPLLKEFCYDCHGEGMEKGKVAFDKFDSEKDLFSRRELWFSVLKNVRAGLMPPEKKPHPTPAQFQQLETWIKQDLFGIDPQNPDPGRVTIRRLNRAEYRNTIHDLTGLDFNVEEELPPDDSGYGFDSIGDVLTISPMLLEKYMQAAETIVAAAVPRMARMVEQRTIPGSAFLKTSGKTPDRLSFYERAVLTNSFRTRNPGRFKIHLDVEVLAPFQFDPVRCEMVFKADDRDLFKKEFGSQNGGKSSYQFEQNWEIGTHPLAIELRPLVPAAEKTNSLDLRINSVRLEGPSEERYWVRPANFDKFFTQDPPAGAAERRAYAREVLRRFAFRAYRRPVDEHTIDRLLALAETVYNSPGKRFEDGIAQAIIPILASPRFLFRVEEPETTVADARFRNLDQYALASRLSYFLWSTMPDEELFQLAGKNNLRANLGAQLKRMLADPRSKALVRNFVGQWLQARDVEGIDINARAVLARDDGEEKELERLRQQFRQGQFRRQLQNLSKEQQAQAEKDREKRRKFFKPRVELDRDLRKAMREETELTFSHVMRENRSVLELLESDYTFLNERLAKHYGITNITGSEMRLVHLPPDSLRGGVLTDGTVLVVTSNPTRTSPVKRGLFILDNILGVPPPPPPPDIPPLEDAEKGVKDREPTLRETLAIHREKPLCSSCHSRMDPLGLALENFNAMGLWRESERKQAIEPAGKLITGEQFKDIRELKHVLVTHRRLDFYRCLTEKLLTYALGRGLEYYDVETVDQIVERMDREGGRFSALLAGIVESAPFQKSRTTKGPETHGFDKQAKLSGPGAPVLGKKSD